MVGTNSLVATPGVTEALQQKLSALKALDVAIASGNTALAQELVEGLWGQGVPPDIIDRARAIVGLDPLCFPATPLIAISPTETRLICDIRVGDTVLAFDPAADLGRGALVPRKVVRLYRNTTDEWVKLRWSEGGESKELISTPGHHFLDHFGQFPTIEAMLRAGKATVVLASGELTEVTAERIVYSAETSHMFERAVAHAAVTGNCALQPVELDAWASYNFEVEDLHTYVAGGVRVHNDSGFLGRVGNFLNTNIDTGLGVKEDSFLDDATDALSAAFHTAGKVLSAGTEIAMSIVGGTVGGIAHAVAGLSGAISGLMNGDLAAAGRSLVGGIGGIVGSVVGAIGGVFEAIFGPGGNSNDPGHTTRTSWTDTDGHPHWGSVNEYDRAVANGTVETGGPWDTDNDGRHDVTGGGIDRADVAASGGLYPILLDLDGDGIEITQLSQSTQFVVGEGGLEHRTAWAGAGDGVLFIDADGSGSISNLSEYVFTEWDASAGDDLEALRRVFDSNGDGKLTSADARWGEFRVQVTNADGSTTVRTLAELGITELNLRPDVTRITLPDGSSITGQSSFLINGVLRTIANTALATEANGYRIVDTVTTDGSGNRVVTQTGYDTAGDRAFVVTSVTSPNGLSVTNRYDIDGNGVTDQLQTIQTTINGNGSRTEMVQNYQGASAATGVLLSRIQTTTSSDGKQVTVLTDSQGGGWFDLREVRTTATDGSRTVTISELAQNGAVITSTSETISANGLVRTTSENLDGIGGADRITTETIVQNAGGDRVITTVVKNQNGSLRTSETETISADGRDKITTRDLNGDGAWDVKVEEDVTVLADGSTSTQMFIRNADGSLQRRVDSTVSADGLVRTSKTDIDGDADFDQFVNDVTLIDGAGTRTRIIKVTNTDGSVNRMEKTVLSADLVSGETWVDLDQNGVFEATELVRQVTVNGSQVKTATTWERNPDGSVRMKVTEVTNAAGTQTVTTVDLDGDGDTDRTITDTKVVNTDQSSTETVTTVNGDGSRRGLEVTTSSADGLHVHISTDIGGSTAYDLQTDSLVTVAASGAVTRTVREFAGNGTTLLGETITETSADRLTTTVSTDANGDGNIDRVTTTTEAVDGSRTVETSTFHADGSLAAHEISSVSANGLVSSTERDVDGDGIEDQVIQDTTVLNANGSTTRIVEERSGDGSLTNRVNTTVSDDGLTTTVQTDANGDGIYEQTVTAATVIQTNGTRVTTATTTTSSGEVLSRNQTSVSDDGLVQTVRTDADGDGDYDLSTSSTTTLLANGGRQTVVDTRDLANVLRSRTITTSSDDLRQITVQEDVNGDGHWDRVTTTSVADTGIVTRTTTETDASGALLARSILTTSDDGLVSTLRMDSDGNGTYETHREAVTVLNADGSATTTTTVYGADNGVISREVVVTSDDGWSTNTTRDLDGDGDIDFTTQRSYALSSAGVETVTTLLTAEDGSLLRRETVTTTADERQVTTAIDSDGDGTTDTQSVRLLQDDGSIVTTTDWRGPAGGLESRSVSVVSGDRLSRTESIDRNGDGRVDLVREQNTELSANGDVITDTSWRNDRFVEQGRMRVETRENGDHIRVLLDHDGDGLYEARSETLREIGADGTITLTQRTFDATSLQTAGIVTTTSGNGLLTQIVADYNGDGAIDRLTTSEIAGDGALGIEVRTYGSDAVLSEIATLARSGDGRFEQRDIDIDANGMVDRRIVTVIDADRNVTVTRTDFDVAGGIEERVTDTVSANGMDRTITFDIDGDGDVDLTRIVEVSFEADGDRVTSRTEYAAPFGPSFGIGRATYVERTVTSADGLGSLTTYDIDGDGDIDGQTVLSHVIHDDASITDHRLTTYANGDLREEVVTETSADGRLIREISDFDGNGIADRIVETRIGVDGSLTVTETGYDVTGLEGQTFVTETSADGLETRIIRPDAVQTIIRSALGDGSYTWNNGVTASTTATNIIVSHVVDGFGIETWTATRTWIASGSTQTRVDTLRLDAAARAELLTEATRIFDTVLDRDMDYSEIETLVLFISNGELDQTQLTSSLIGSGEFSTRYGSLTAVEFLTQVYLNALQRPPSMEEINAHLQDGRLTNSTTTAAARAEIAVQLAESAEHIAIGNGHLATNNFDVILNPAQFERSIDRAWVESVVARLVDAVYDRDATAQEMETLSARLLGDTANPDDLVALLLQADGTQFGTATNSLAGLTGAALVEQAFINALGRQPTAGEQQAWEDHLAARYLTTAQFIASLALSVEQDAAGNGHVASVLPAVTVLAGTSAAETLSGGNGQDLISGGSGNDVLNGGAGADLLIGGAGADTLNGGNGSDIYRWSRGSGNDLIQDTGSDAGLALRQDLLELTDVASTEVTLSRGGSGNISLLITVTTGGTTETIEVRNYFQSSSNGPTLQAIAFSDGVVWRHEDISEQSSTSGLWGYPVGAGDDLIDGYVLPDVLLGLGGNDIISGNAGNDTLVGGTGNDLLSGGAGSDTYRWAVGDGNDTINDGGSGTSDVDFLELAGVLPDNVTLARPTGSYNLVLTVTVGGVARNITVQGQYSAVRAGIEGIRFGDGTSWDYSEILSRTILTGTAGNDNMSIGTSGGTALADRLAGAGGNDTILGGAGGDTLVGGAGNDSLVGGAGADAYWWAAGHGNDTISDGGTVSGEIDKLELDGINSGAVTLQRLTGTNDLRIVIGSEIIVVTGFFTTTPIEQIAFDDGTIWTVDDIIPRTKTPGGSSADVLAGLAGADNLFGYLGNDTINAGSGDDYITGGGGDDSLAGGDGSDRYFWTTGEGNDTINDAGLSLTDVDSLFLNGVSSAAATLERSGNDLLITIGAATIRVINRFNNASDGRGVEVIEFGDGVVTRILESDVATILTTGTTAGNNLNGWGFRDRMEGLAGNDKLEGHGGEDTLVGGTGVDTLHGGDGADSYEWARGDGSDIVIDSSISLTQIDRLVLTNVMSADDVELIRLQNSEDLLIRITTGTSVETLTIQDRYHDNGNGYGIEAIEFGDGTLWYLDRILAETELRGTSGNDNLRGSIYADNILGLAGNDTIESREGDDIITGGLGADHVNGESGSDRYIWSIGDGNDTINDESASLIESDTLVLTDILPEEIALTRANGNATVLVTITSGGVTSVISVLSQIGSSINGTGIERIEFADGTIWDLDRILAETRVNGTSAGETLSGTAYRDNLFGGAGNDVLSSANGNDWLQGGTGNDTLTGGNGSDTYVWQPGDGDDQVNDAGASTDETDVLVINSVGSSQVGLHRVSGSNDLIVRVYGSGTYDDIRIVNQFADGGDSAGQAGTGVEIIRLGDGTEWALADIVARANFHGTAGNDTIIGTSQNDNMFGADGNDSLSGGAGNDSLYGGLGADTLNGGDGVDTAFYTDATSGVTIDLRLAGAQAGDPGGVATGDILIGIEALTGSSFNDNLIGDDESNELSAGAGDDTLSGLDGFDQLYGGAGNDTISGGIGADLLLGESGNDLLYGNAGDDSLSGGDGNDALVGGDGADQLAGGEGLRDRAQYHDATSGLRADLLQSSTNTGFAAGDIYSDIEDLYGSVYADSLLGDNGANIVWGADGNDTLYGRGGADTLYGGDGNDALVGGLDADWLDGGAGDRDRAYYGNATAGLRADLQQPSTNTGFAAGDSYVGIEDLYGSNHGDSLLGDAGDNVIWGVTGNDALYGRAGEDSLYGGDGDDTLGGGDGADWIDGGAGSRDRVQYQDATAGLRADLGTASTNTGFAAGDIYVDVEDLYGSAYGDSLLGDAGTNMIWGGTGDDILYGRTGADTLYGGDDNDLVGGNEGSDLLYGGAGADAFIFDRDLGAGNVDVIGDFSAVDDTIRLDDAIFSAITLGALGAGAFTIGTAATTSSHRIVYNQTTGQLYYDADGAGAGAAVQFATLTAGTALSSGDFVII